jgi:hypothetical protein
MLSEVYEIMAASEQYEKFAERHNIRSAPNLTIVDEENAELVCAHLAPRISGKVVVEVGGGIGMLSLAMAKVATRVFCIEANPAWAASWTQILLERKPRNASYLFGAADEFVGSIRGDVAVICTHSDVAGMKLVAQQFAGEVIDVYGEIISPETPLPSTRWRRGSGRRADPPRPLADLAGPLEHGPELTGQRRQKLGHRRMYACQAPEVGGCPAARDQRHDR